MNLKKYDANPCAMEKRFGQSIFFLQYSLISTSAISAASTAATAQAVTLTVSSQEPESLKTMVSGSGTQLSSHEYVHCGKVRGLLATLLQHTVCRTGRHKYICGMPYKARA